ncbi:hypothetical protein BGW80DRAFT_1562519, partial [Lactifluus volemus]
MSQPYDKTKFLRTLVDDSVHALVRTQHVVSFSGNVFTGGLEEPVFDIHLGKITDPASHGPPFRAVILIKYAEWLIEPEQRNGTWVADVLWPAINLDCNGSLHTGIRALGISGGCPYGEGPTGQLHCSIA